MSLNLIKLEAMKKINNEFKILNHRPIVDFGLTVGLIEEEDIFKWRVTMPGPKDTSYKGGIFLLIIKFPEDYPQHPPEVCFKTPIYHINVNPNKSDMPGAKPLGHVYIPILNQWKPEYTVMEVFANIFGLFYMAIPGSPYGFDRDNEFRYQRDLYKEKIKRYTKKYADPRNFNINKECHGSWDFSN